MEKLKPGRSCRCLFALLLSLLGTPHLFGDCKAPHSRIGKFVDNTASSVLLNISIRPEDFAPARLVCLANVLRQKYQAQEIGVGIFSSHKAAFMYRPLSGELGANKVLWASKRHAEYYYSAEKHEEYLLLTPDGLKLAPNAPFNTRIDLPVVGRPSCTLEIRGRCLLEIDYIESSLKNGGTVILTAQIERNGTVSGVRVIADTNPVGPQNVLADFAMQYLKSWRFEGSRHKDTIKFEYSLGPVNTLSENGVNVQSTLPDIKILNGELVMPR